MKTIRWVLSLSVVLYGIATIDTHSVKWAFLGTFLFSIPFILQFSNSQVIRIWSLWGGLFLVLQSLLSPIVIDRNHITVMPNTRSVINVKGGLPGVHGRQVITTDAYGFRATPSVNYGDASTFRIFAIGGSTTEQDYLDDSRTWTHLLQERLSHHYRRPIEVINTGVDGTRAIHHLATLKQIANLHPDGVVVLLGINDWIWHIYDHFPDDHQMEILNRMPVFLEPFRLRATLLATAMKNTVQIAKYRASQFNTPAGIEHEEYGTFYTKQRGSLNRNRTYSFRPPGVHEQYKQALAEMSAFCKGQSIPCMFVTQPSGYQNRAAEEFKKGFWMTPPNRSYTLDFDSLVYLSSLYNAYLIKFSTEQGHPLCDVASRLTPSYENFFDDCHFNTEGSIQVAHALSDCFVRADPISGGNITPPFQSPVR